MKPAHILLIGDDQAHLDTRVAVLKHFWTVATSSEAGSRYLAETTDLAVLCHTIPDAERQEMVMRLRHEHPSMLLVKVNGYDSGPHAGADATVDAMHGPAALVSTIYELVTERGLASRAWSDNPAGAEVDLDPFLAIH